MTQEVDKISQFLGTATGVTPLERNKVMDTDIKDLSKSLREQQNENLSQDYPDARTNIKELINETMGLLPDVVALTREAQSASMYLAASSFVKMLAELNKDLLIISQGKDSPIKQHPPAVDSSKPEGNTTVFIGTSEEVFKQFSRRKKEGVQEGEFIEIKPESAVIT